MAWFDNTYEAPRLNRDDPLVNGLTFATRCGWSKGFRATGGIPQDAGVESVRGQLGQWSSSSIAGSYTVMDGGPCFDAGTTPDEMNYSNSDGRYVITRGMSCVAFCRLKVNINNEAVCVANQNGTTPASGYGMAANSGSDPNQNAWHFQINNGAVSEVSAAAGSQDLVRAHMMAMVFDPNIPSLTGWKDGVRIASVATSSSSIVNPASTFTLDLMGDPHWDMQMLMAAVWNRPLSVPEIQRITTDPLILWREENYDEFIFGGIAPLSIPGFFLTF